MKSIVRLLVGASVLMFIVSCAGGDEAAGDKAYNMSKKATGNARRTQLKTAYINYDKAVKANPAKASKKLRDRFLEMAIVRVKMVLEEGNANMGAIPLLMDDIEAQFAPEYVNDIAPEWRNQYAAFVAQLGDSSAAKDKFINALAYYDRAIEKAADASPFREKRAAVVRNVAQENFEIAQMEFEMAAKNKKEMDVEGLIRAEYYAHVALYFDSTFAPATKLLSGIRKENIGSYTAYPMVITDYTDTVMFRRINKLDILLAIPAVLTRGGATTAEIHMHNNSYNALRMRSDDFAIVDVNGREYKANASQKMEPEFLDQEREGKFTLRFPAPAAAIQKVIYRNGPHYTEKNFM
ncbi:MAG: hypothetical protein LBI42_06275 [Chitinispirillales bacterium]|jgi:tetratricopeptide (TPR) repeat protein|nr:hypothetical protein [Chitinispirillales bacterium]